ncbi:MAG: HD domain-containing protein [Saprospirales bacterium]|nr:HD domain-containing protein [Saprospirales bacterium]MBK8489893.1 HD domain-containing protein [Saprospirales bacterium]
MDQTTGGFDNRYQITNESELAELLTPETEMEWSLLQHPDFCRGLIWGEPRFGHPEGKVALHVREVMDNIDRLEIDSATRRQLRIIALVHDAFKCVEDKNYPRDWSRHHSVLARKFLEAYTKDEAVLKVVELHDEAYYAWRAIHLYKNIEEGQQRFQRLLDRLGKHLPLYFLFFKCDTETGDKNQAPLRWLEEILEEMKR